MCGRSSAATPSDLYSVAILLEEAGLLGRSRIYATEADAERLASAQSGLLAAASVRLAERNYRTHRRRACV